ncbi:unnamed protein product, partial [Polarella glacialis]
AALALPAKVVQVAAGESHALLVTMSGGTARVFAVGDNEFGQLGQGDTSRRRDSNVPVEVSTLSYDAAIAGVACGGQVCMAVSQRGEIWSWGRNQ